MCPACMASAALVAGSVVSTGGLTALLWKVLGKKNPRLTTVQRRGNEDGNSDQQS